MRCVAAFLCIFAGVLMAQDSRNWINQGVSEFKAGNYAGAVADFQKAVDAEPNSAIAHLYLATAWMQQFIPGVETPENLAAATKANDEFVRTLELEPGNKSAMMSIASLALNQKKWDDAQAWYQKVVAADPGNAVAWYSMGFIAWSRWYPAYSGVRAAAGLKPPDPGPLPAGSTKEQLRTEYNGILEGGMYALQQAMLIDPQYDDAMAYMNLLIRERADLRDNSADYQRDIAEANAWVDKALATKRTKAEHQAASGMAAPPPPPPPPPPPGNGGVRNQDMAGRIRVAGNVMQAMLVRQDPPVYPADAKRAGISGSVTLSVLVGADGTVKDVNLRDGQSALAQAAIDAVRTWTYKPTLLNEEAVEVETTVTVNFTLH